MPSPLTRFRVTRSLLRLTSRVDGFEDPWQCVEIDVDPDIFGPGSIHDFPWYFEGESAVPVSTFEDVCAWLLGCTCARDPDLFRVPDFWQHPVTFEALRKGDCEDHSLWAWRKLRELGLRAHLVSGSCSRDDADPGNHAWVVFHGDGGLYLLEATAKSREQMVWPLDSVRQLYQPHVSVDETFTLFLYGGFARHLEAHWEARRRPPAPEGT
jgi:hypothetical protein